MTFKELKKIVSINQNLQQQNKFFERLRTKPFWIWNIDKHKQEDVRTNGDCCFNHVIGLPQKNSVDKPLYGYEKIIFDSLVLSIFGGLSPTNVHNSDVLRRIVYELDPDVIHVQYEHGLYGVKSDPINPRKFSTNIDLFYEQCNNIPIVTTFHSTYNFMQVRWIMP